jgi:hypothetical protein
MVALVEAFMNHSADTDSHGHTAERERQIREAALDETIAESFPASDPPSTDPNPDNHDAITPDTSQDDTREGRSSVP